MRLSDKVALVTGSAQGIGLATAVRFAQEGARVVVADLQPQRVDAAVRAFRGRAEPLDDATTMALRVDA